MFAIVRIYADANGDSHFDESTISLLPSGMIGNLSEPVPAKEIIFREVEPNYDWSYHYSSPASVHNFAGWYDRN